MFSKIQYTPAVLSYKVSQGTQIILWLSCFLFHVTRLLILAVIFVKLDWRICTRRTSTLATWRWTLRPCLRQVHLALAQSDEQLHLIICRSHSGAAGRSVIRGTTWPSVTFHPAVLWASNFSFLNITLFWGKWHRDLLFGPEVHAARLMINSIGCWQIMSM